MAISRLFREAFRPAGFVIFASALSLQAFALPGDATLVTRVEPEFPREAMLAGAEKGMVRARMTLDGGGEVTRVEILEANPRRVFDRAVVKTLALWKFNPGREGRAVEIDVEFKR
jgi:protein TonB